MLTSSPEKVVPVGIAVKNWDGIFAFASKGTIPFEIPFYVVIVFRALVSVKYLFVIPSYRLSVDITWFPNVVRIPPFNSTPDNDYIVVSILPVLSRPAYPFA